MEKRSAISMAPICLPVMPDSPVMAPTRLFG
jgi:hypothetical protein